MKKRMLAVLLALAMSAAVPAAAMASEGESVAAETEAGENPDQTGEISGTQSSDSMGSEGGTPEDTSGDGSVNRADLAGDEVQEQVESAGGSALPKLSYRVHVQTYGWQDFLTNGETAGTTGEAKRLEAIELKIENSAYEGGIEYCTHVQTYGWQDWVSDGAVSGTSGQAKRLEAIQIRLTGEIEEHYDVYYRVHAQTYGWLGWAKNGERAGSSSYAKRLEAIEIVLVEKDGPAPGETAGTYIRPGIQYQSHVQTYGWQTEKADGVTSGTSGEAKRLEALRIRLYEPENFHEDGGGVEYCAHVQTYGWQDWVSDGELMGTTGEAKRLEAVRIQLTGKVADRYSIYYRVHCQTLGWTGWAKDGDPAGSEGFAKRLEAIEIRVVSKDSQDAPDTSDQTFVARIQDADVSLSGRVQEEADEGLTENDISVTGNGQILGDPAAGSLLSGFGITLNPDNANIPLGAVQYRAHSQSVGWQDWVEQGQYAGTSGKRLEAIQIQLTERLSQFYDVYYRVSMESFGWLGWAKNGDMAGSSGYSRGLTAIQVQLVAKNDAGPKTGQTAYLKKAGTATLSNPCPAAYISDEFGEREAPTAGASTYHRGRDYAAAQGTPIYAASSGIVKTVAYNSVRGYYVILEHGQGLSTLYQHCSKINVKEGQSVFVGTKIAEVGSTGIVTGPHLHFEVWENGTPVDPRLYL